MTTNAPSLEGIVRAYYGQPVFVTGGPARTPFTGKGPSRFSNPAYALHHARSWESPFALGSMPPLHTAGYPHTPAAVRVLERHHRALSTLAEGPLPAIAQVWGPMTLAAEQTGLEEALLLFSRGSDPAVAMAAGLEATLVAARRALATRPLVLWIGEPLPVLVDPGTLERTWLAPMRTLIALARNAGAEPVIHMSGTATHVLPIIERTGASGVSITAGTPLSAARELLGEHMVVFGNLDSMRLLDRDSGWLAEQARSMVATMRDRPFVLTPGSALPDRMPVEKLVAFVDAGRF